MAKGAALPAKSTSSLPQVMHPGSKTAGGIRIVEVDEDEHTFKLSHRELERVLLDPAVADKKVAVISVAGAYRKGKSFLLNFFIRYLTWRERPELAGSDWLAADTPLTGFSWRGGSERDTNGILIWERPFLLKDKNGEEIAVLLMDTQGSFDTQSTVKDCATVFALSTIVSSLQIYNISQNIQEDDLQHLQLFTEYGRLALSNSTAKPFQSLLFLVRDWSYPYDAAYGFSGGQTLIDKRLQESDRQHPELQQLRRHIRSCFEQIECFLMPHPGLKVATNPNFGGKLSELEMDSKFSKHLAVLIPRLLDRKNLEAKEVNGAPVRCRGLVEYFKVYLKMFQGKDLPEPKSILLATAEANNLAAVANARSVYQRHMEEFCGGDRSYLPPAELESEHQKFFEKAIHIFQATKKMGGHEFSKAFQDKLEEDIMEVHENLRLANSSKNIWKSLRSPLVILSVFVLNSLLHYVLAFLFLDSFAALLCYATYTCVASLLIWLCSRFSGRMRETSALIDSASSWLFSNWLPSDLVAIAGKDDFKRHDE